LAVDPGPVRGNDPGRVGGGYRILHRADEQLRRQHERPAVAVLADATLATSDPPGRRPAGTVAVGPGTRGGALGAVGAERVLPGVEPVAVAVADAVHGVQRVATILTPA